MKLQMPQGKLERIGTVFMAIGTLNFLVMMVCVFGLGGEALSGKVQGGHYYLGYKNSLTQVSKMVYIASLWNDWSAIIFYPLGALLASPSAMRRKAGRRAV